MTKKENAALANENGASKRSNDTTFFCARTPSTRFIHIAATPALKPYSRS